MASALQSKTLLNLIREIPILWELHGLSSSGTSSGYPIMSSLEGVQVLGAFSLFRLSAKAPDRQNPILYL